MSGECGDLCGRGVVVSQRDIFPKGFDWSGRSVAGRYPRCVSEWSCNRGVAERSAVFFNERSRRTAADVQLINWRFFPTGSPQADGFGRGFAPVCIRGVFWIGLVVVSQVAYTYILGEFSD